MTDLSVPPVSLLPGAEGEALHAADLAMTEPIVAPGQLAEAIDRQARRPAMRIGEALLSLGLIDERTLGDALQQQTRDRHVPLGELLVQRGVVSRAALQAALVRKMGFPVVDLAAFPAQPDALRRLPAALARRLPALPLMLRGEDLVVALDDPSARILIDEVELGAEAKVVPVLAEAGSLLPAIERHYALLGGRQGPDTGPVEPIAVPPATARERLDSLAQRLAGDRAEDARADLPSDGAVNGLIDTMVNEARAVAATAIHIDGAHGEPLRIRWRREGRLQHWRELPPGWSAALIARLKALAGLDGAETTRPQHGTMGRREGVTRGMSLTTLPTADGQEDAVLRLQAPPHAMTLQATALAPGLQAALRRVMERRGGLVLCVGPAGSGRTTMLHAALQPLNTPTRKIWTVEHPVEIRQPGLRQMPLDPRSGMSVAGALHSVLQADADVVMLGMLHDPETARAAVDAAAQGVLVLSALPSANAAAAVTWLLDLGVDRFGLAEALRAVLSLRLVRRLCPHCVTRRPATADETDALLDAWHDADAATTSRKGRTRLLAAWLRDFGDGGALMHHHARGCHHCGHSGFGGRIGLQGLQLVDGAWRRWIEAGAAPGALPPAPHTLRRDGVRKVLAGLATLDDVRAASNS